MLFVEALRGRFTIHGFSLDAIVSVTLGEEELEVSLWVLDVADLIVLIDKVAERVRGV